MTNEEIKSEVDKLNGEILFAQSRLHDLREEICKHEKTFEGNYSWRPGVMQLADICEYCGKVIKFKSH